MGRKKKIEFKLDPMWLLKDPVDFEYNKYTLLNYLQKCETVFNNLELYPDFIELSLHLANVQSIFKNKKILTTNKKFESCDDEILLKDLIELPFRELNEDEQEELEKTIAYSGTKLFDAFSVGKTIWNLVFDDVDLMLRKNKEGIARNKGYIFFGRKDTNTLFVWEYILKKQKNNTDKIILTKIHEDLITNMSVSSAIENFSSFKENKNYLEFPIFEVRCSKYFPMEQTFIPIVKRKVLSYIYQVISFENVSKF